MTALQYYAADDWWLDPWAPRGLLAATTSRVRLASEILARVPRGRRLFLFINVSAIHQPNRFYLPGAEADTLESHAAALEHVDGQLPRLFTLLQRRAPVAVILCSDHGTAYGEDGHTGHRYAHPVVWTVPYAEFLLPQENAAGGTRNAG